MRFDQSAGSSYDSVLSGAGQLTKTGGGTLMLTADSSAFTGRTEVQAGTLMVGNKLGGDVSVTSGLLYIDGVLGGNAAISGGGMLFNGGRITGNATLAGGVLIGEQGSKLSLAATSRWIAPARSTCLWAARPPRPRLCSMWAAI
ncbi:autotransporter-associated beta strand repeat-containing protein [Achromobacter marplatensis]|uniref:autotransporter-associated beta strand repeat-containing protein n=1 Tax=Achromobacter marplatensis TaxID=470868 RepID=UPI003D02674F